MAINFKFVNSPMINNNGGIKHVCNKEIIFNIWCFGIYSPMVHSNTLINYILHVIPADVYVPCIDNCINICRMSKPQSCFYQKPIRKFNLLYLI